jgi:uncharacterized protein (TIGR03086 family)
MDVSGQYRQASNRFGTLVRTVSAGQWHDPTPCAGWDVRTLVNHVVGENRWAVPLFAGQTVADVGDRLDGDLLGEDPIKAWDVSAADACDTVDHPGAMTATVHLSFGDFSGEEYANQLFADLLIHGWDLARAIGADEHLDPNLTQTCERWFTSWEDGYRQAGAVGPRVSVETDDPATQLLAAFGRNPSQADTLSVIQRFNTAFGRRDVDAVMALMTDDCIFEDTSPPHGGRHVGQAEVRATWEKLFSGFSPTATFTTEDGFVCGDRATYRWLYNFDGGSVRGVDVFRVADGKVAEKLAYVKG